MAMTNGTASRMRATRRESPHSTSSAAHTDRPCVADPPNVHLAPSPPRPLPASGRPTMVAVWVRGWDGSAPSSSLPGMRRRSRCRRAPDRSGRSARYFHRSRVGVERCGPGTCRSVGRSGNARPGDPDGHGYPGRRGYSVVRSPTPTVGRRTTTGHRSPPDRLPHGSVTRGAASSRHPRVGPAGRPSPPTSRGSDVPSRRVDASACWRSNGCGTSGSPIARSG